MDLEVIPPTPGGYMPWDTSAGNRLSHYSPEDHSAPLWIASLLGMIYLIGVLLIRVYVKRRVMGWDDYLLIASSVIALAQSIVIYSSLKSGLGKIPQNVSDIRHVGKGVYSSRILFLVSLYLAKCSVLFLLRRLFVRDQKRTVFLCNLALGFTVISGIVSAFASTVQCPSAGLFVRHCGSQVTRWSVVTALDVITEVLMLLLPPYMVWQLQMKTETKLRVIAAFCFRIFVIVISALHLHAIVEYTSGPPSPFHIIQSLVLQQSLLAWSLVSATIPNLKAFLQSLSANWGGHEWGYSTNYGHGTIELNEINTQRTTASKRKSEVRFSVQESSNFDTQVYTSTGEGGSVASGGSQDLIIRKETVWTVERT